MPHIVLQMFPGRPEAVKAELVKTLQQVTVDALGCKPEHVSVSIDEIVPADWNEKVPFATPKESVMIGPIYIVE